MRSKELVAFEVQDDSLAGAGILPGAVVMVVLGEDVSPGDLALVYHPSVGRVLRYVAELCGQQVFLAASPGYPAMREGIPIGKAVRVLVPVPAAR